MNGVTGVAVRELAVVDFKIQREYAYLVMLVILGALGTK